MSKKISELAAYSGSAPGTALLEIASGGVSYSTPLSDARAHTEAFLIACSDETSALTIGTGKVTFRMPYAFTVSSVKASLTTTQSTGSILTVNIKKAGVSILGSLLTIDNGEKTSATAATAATVTSPSLASDAEIAIDVTQVGDGTATGLKVYVIGSQ